MIVTRSSGPTSLRMNAAAPALIASNRASSSSVCGEHDDPGRGQLALDPLGRLDPAGRRQRQVHEDDVRRGLEGAIDRRPAVVGLADDLEVRLALQDVADPDAEQRVVVDDQDPRPLPVAPGDPVRRGAVPVRRVAHQLVSSAPIGIASLTSVPPSGRECTSKRAPISSARSRMNWRPKLRRPRAATAPTSNPRPSSRTVEDPVVAVDRAGDGDGGGRAVLAYILQCFLQDAQHDRLLGRAQPVRRRRQVRADREPGQRRDAADGVGDRAVQPELVEDRRPELADERPDRPELAAEQVAQEAQLRLRGPEVRVDHPLDVLDLEDRVRRGPGPVRRGPPGRAATAPTPGPRRSASGRRSRRVSPSPTRLESPRSRKSHVDSRLRRAISSLASSVCWTPSSRPSESTSRPEGPDAGVLGADLGRDGGSVRPASVAVVAPSPPVADRGGTSGDALRSAASSSSRSSCQRASSSV